MIQILYLQWSPKDGYLISAKTSKQHFFSVGDLSEDKLTFIPTTNGYSDCFSDVRVDLKSAAIYSNGIFLISHFAEIRYPIFHYHNASSLSSIYLKFWACLEY